MKKLLLFIWNLPEWLWAKHCEVMAADDPEDPEPAGYCEICAGNTYYEGERFCTFCVITGETNWLGTERKKR